MIYWNPKPKGKKVALFVCIILVCIDITGSVWRFSTRSIRKNGGCKGRMTPAAYLPRRKNVQGKIEELNGKGASETRIAKATDPIHRVLLLLLPSPSGPTDVPAPTLLRLKSAH